MGSVESSLWDGRGSMMKGVMIRSIRGTRVSRELLESGNTV